VIRFSCPQCGKILKVPEENAGRAMVCPRCQEPSVAPAAEGRTPPAERPGQHIARDIEQTQGLISGMSWRVRGAVILVASVGVLGLLLSVLPPLWSVHGGDAQATAPGAAILVPCSVVFLLIILYGQGTSCPSCQGWWVRTRVETEFLEREVFDKGGVPFGRSMYRTTYQCASCRHRWSVTHTEEYRETVRNRQRQLRR
jgi:hypothetical protein